MICLKKGDYAGLDRSITLCAIGMGWQASENGGLEPDLDLEAFLLSKNGKARSDDDMVFYNHVEHSSRSVISKGDIRKGGGSEEVIVVNLSKVPAYVEKIAITASIYDARALNQKFGSVSEAYIHVDKISDPEDERGEEIIRYNLEEEFGSFASVLVCEIVRAENGWRFNAVGKGFSFDLRELCIYYGLEVE